MAQSVAGDLLTGQHVRSLQESRTIESIPDRRLQAIVFIMGLFHLKMAMADAIHRIFLDDNSLISHIAQICPKETSKIQSDPGFCRMHEVIQHVGITSWIEAWRQEASECKSGIKSLSDFAESKPTWEEVCSMANDMARKYVATDDLTEQHSRSDRDRDKQFENMLETSYALNFGDIGQVEALFLPWMMIFAGCGKHKYAAEMRRYLENVHFIYPPRLAHAIRMNILVNPTGKQGQFCALDWVVEHNNLYIKRIYGGKYANHQKSRIIDESLLIEAYKNIRHQFEQMFCFEHRASRHSPPRMEITFKKLTKYMEEKKTYATVKGRNSAYSIPDIMSQGLDVLTTRAHFDVEVYAESLRAGEELEDEDVEVEVENEWSELADGQEEVEDDGSLDL
ncbi:hypothetical protein BDQ12DRAFT_698959 [Crucibulum laeve]|uniref:DUF6589 domain-containing protein n=1 Tax=Crucibulum laeve TaxID=68775 RepID=A0A5C3LXG7_9AGAR|nr:hypothetical protein BDQ12DRAFT_698959 [Crucibulum laeve]